MFGRLPVRAEYAASFCRAASACSGKTKAGSRCGARRTVGLAMGSKGGMAPKICGSGANFKTSRSQLYAEALSEYLARHAPDEVTEAMNQALDQLSQSTDSFARAASRRVLERSEW